MTNTTQKVDDIEVYRRKLIGSFLYFTKVFYRLRTGRLYSVSEPVGRESHYLTIAKALTKVVDGKISRLIINVPPRYGKTELLIHFVAWAMAQYPDSNFIYVSYSHSLAKKQTQTIREIMQLTEYKDLFGVSIKEDVSAKDNFETTANGSVYAAGSGGTITGRGAGIKGCDRFGGIVVIDDIHKPDEMSDTIRQGVNEWYHNTLQSRINTPNTPIAFIGQRLHEDDLASNLITSGDWETVIIPALDEAGNALDSNMHDVNALLALKEQSPYNFASQYQQNPIPAGGGIFKPDWFVVHEFEPDILKTFITIDTAETSKSYNDATVFSFWGIYRVKHGFTDTDIYALHWLNCVEARVEPKDLEQLFMEFYADCMRHKVKPMLCAIEKKSTGVTLLSTLSKYQGIQLLNIERTRTAYTHSSGGKAARYLEAQPYVAQKLVSLPLHSKHTNICIEHCQKITLNDSHRHDDICDTLYDAIKIALIDKIIIMNHIDNNNYNKIAQGMKQSVNKFNQLRNNAYR